MTQVSGIPYRRHGPTAALREFLDPLDPGDYFDCGRARLHGLDDALLAEARSRGRTVGDDAFLLVATDMGLIFCRPSISFAIAARWQDISLIRPRGDDPVVLPVSWPRHGELKFTLSKRLAGNIFRRWLQLRMQAARRARDVETGQHRLFTPLEAGVATGPPAGTVEAPFADDEQETSPGVGGLAEGSIDDVDPVDDPGPVGETERGQVDPTRADSPIGTDEAIDTDGPTDTDEAIDTDGPTDTDEPADTGDPTGTDDATGEPTPLGGPGLDPERGSSSGDEEPVFAAVTDRPEPRTGAVDRLDPELAEFDGLADDALERVTIPRDGVVTPSWVGSAVSVAATLVVVSTVVLIGAVSVSLYRGAIETEAGTEAGAEVSQTTVDHRRFRPSSDPDGSLGPDPDPLGPSAPGGASQSAPSSSQQLLAVQPESTDPDRARRCSSNYGGCVPDVSDIDGADVDCPGQGDGPYFADGEVVVLGPDLYGLDSDGDGVACEPDQVADVGQPSVPVEPADPLAPADGTLGP